MSETVRPDSDRSSLAAELALGLLEGQELLDARRLAMSDPDFAREVDGWQSRIDGWIDAVDGIQPPAGLRSLVEARIDEPRAPAPASRWTAGRWKSVALVSMAASLLLAIALGLALNGNEREPAPPSTLANAAVGQINGADGTPLLSAAFERDTATLYLRVADLGGAESAPELWLIPEGGAPKSLGLIRGDSVTISVTPEVMALLAEQATLAITVEPLQGAPHAAPTGPIIGTAKLQSL